jgi:hypothetical protein
MIESVFIGGGLFLFVYVVMHTSTRSDTRTTLALTGIVVFVFFALAVQFPFYFQGYVAELAKCTFNGNELVCPISSKVKGLTSIRIIGNLSYLLSGNSSLGVLTAAALGLVFGKLTKRPQWDFFIRLAVLVLILISINESWKYIVINWALE